MDVDYLDDYAGIAKGSKRAPPLVPIDIEDGGITIYRPMLEFSKDRLIATCVENDIPWFEDHTNADPTLTMRNAVRHLHQNHKLPAALQKPAILQLAGRCRTKVASEEAEAARLLGHVLARDFEPSVGTAVVQLRQFRFPMALRGRLSSPARRERRLDHYRNITAILVRRLLSLVTPERELPPLGQLDYLVSLLFPSLSKTKPRLAPKAYVICGVHFIPLIGDYPFRWLLSRAPHVSNVPRPSVVSSKLHITKRFNKHPSAWKFHGWDDWHLFDGRYWFRIRTRLPFRVRVAPFEIEHQKPFREALGDPHVRDNLSLLLKRYAPAKVRYTLPAIYATTDVSELLAGGAYWPAEPVEEGNPAGQLSNGDGEVEELLPERFPNSSSEWKKITKDRKTFYRRLSWEQEVVERGSKPQLLALPTLGISLPGVEDWLNWEFRYRKVDFELLQQGMHRT